jgi:sugar phosphate isomerase/epimerase
MDMVSNWFPSATQGPGLLGFTNEQAFDYAEALHARSVTAVVFAAAPSQDELIDSFAALCDHAAERGLLVHLEFIPFSPVRTVGDALAIVEAANRPNGGIMLDAWHLYRSGGTASDVQAAAKHILGVQLDDAPVEPEKNLVAETTQRRLLPGQGDADVPGIIRALRSGGSTAPLGVEVFSETLAALPPEEVARQAFAAAKDCIKKSL